jgi:hypothetical protein
MVEKRNILFLDIDGVLNSNRSFFKKFADHYGVEWTDDDFDIEKWYGKGHTENMNPDLWKRMEEAKENLTKELGYPDIGMYKWPHEEEAIENLNTIIRENDADVVICSSWRNSRTVEELQEILDGWGFKGKVVGKTIYLHRDYNARGLEIMTWILDYRHYIKGVCILDDEAEYDINPVCGTWAVQGISGYKHGLRKEHISMAKECFEKEIRPLRDFVKWASPDELAKARKIDSELAYQIPQKFPTLQEKVDERTK